EIVVDGRHQPCFERGQCGDRIFGPAIGKGCHWNVPARVSQQLSQIAHPLRVADTYPTAAVFDRPVLTLQYELPELPVLTVPDHGRIQHGRDQCMEPPVPSRVTPCRLRFSSTEENSMPVPAQPTRQELSYRSGHEPS